MHAARRRASTHVTERVNCPRAAGIRALFCSHISSFHHLSNTSSRHTSVASHCRITSHSPCRVSAFHKHPLKTNSNRITALQKTAIPKVDGRFPKQPPKTHIIACMCVCVSLCGSRTVRIYPTPNRVAETGLDVLDLLSRRPRDQLRFRVELYMPWAEEKGVYPALIRLTEGPSW